MREERDDGGTRLRALLNDGFCVVPACYDAVSARVLEAAGFLVLALSGAGLAATLGVSDDGLVTMTELVTAVRSIARVLTVPLLVDADTGFGGPANVARTARELAQSGVAAMQIEDQEFPKRSVDARAKAVVAEDAFAERIAAAAEGRGRSSMLIVARSDALDVHGVEGAISRVNRALAAGADIGFVHGTAHGDLPRVARAIRGPALTARLPRRGDRVPAFADIEAMGYAAVVLPAIALFPAVAAIAETARRVMSDGTDAAVAEFGLGAADIGALLEGKPLPASVRVPPLTRR